MKNVFFRVALMVFMVFSVILSQLPEALARPGGGPGGPHGSPEYVNLGYERYRYRDGRFYRPVFFGLFEILVDIPPAGVVVTVLPPARKTIVVDGLTYYYYNNVYFTAAPGGYVVVPAPSAAPVLAAPVQQQKITGETATINIPNANGSYTPVTLVKQKDGYVGPQGEYYPGHPTVEQLRVLYGK